MGTENNLNPRRQHGKSSDRGTIGCEISLGAVEPDGAGIVCVAGEEQAVGGIKYRDRVWCVAGCGDDFQCSSAQIDPFTIVNIGLDLPGPGRVGLRVKSLWQMPTNLIGRDFGL